MTDHFELAKSIVSGTLDLLCPEMRLVACPGYQEVLVEGCGVIRADRRGQLSFTLAGKIAAPIPNALRPYRPPGELYDFSDYVMLVAVDASGGEWRSNQRLIHLTAAELIHGYLTRQIDDLLQCRKWGPSKTSSVEIFLPWQTRLPMDIATTETKSIGTTTIGTSWAVDRHKRQIGPAEVTFRAADEDWLIVTASQAAPIMPDWPGLLCHAIEFAAAERARPAVVTRAFNDSEHCGIFSGPFTNPLSRLPRIHDGISPEDAAPFWSAVEKFVVHFQQHGSTLELLLEELSGIRNGATGSIQTAVLTLAVGIESISKQLISGEAIAVTDKKAVESLIEHTSGWNGDSNLKSRAIAVLGQLASVRAVDLLYAWASRTGSPHELVDAWKKLRNPRAHGAAVEEDQELSTRYYKAVELMYRLVASSIAYDWPADPKPDQR
jgi:hypothetical protein